MSVVSLVRGTVTGEEECLAALQKAAEILDESPTKAAYEELGLTPASATIMRVLGGWNTAKRAAGLETFEQGDNGGMDIQPKPESVEIPEEAAWDELTGQQRWYYKNHQHRIAVKERRRRSLHTWFYELKRDEYECTRCGEDRPPTLDFHHPDQKELSVSEMVNDGYSKASIREEIDRCLVLCANCHRKEHQKRPNDVSEREVSDADIAEVSEHAARKERRRWLFARKRRDGCSRCSVSDPRCLDFHHEDEKTRGIGKMGSFGHNRNEIRAELEKCVLLCANCHRGEHFDRPSRERYDTHK